MAQLNVFEQVVKLISRSDFEASVRRHHGNRGVRELDCWTWFGALLFGQLSGHDSIRAMERVFCHGNLRMRGLGFSTVCRSTLSDANQSRPLGILEDTLQNLLERTRLLCPGLRNGLRFQGQVFALDSSTIELCLSLSPWANYRNGTAGVKLHTAIDLAGDLPEISIITPAKANDIPVAKAHFHFKPGTTVVFDRGYWDSAWLNALDQAGIFFVTRQRKNNRFKVVESRPTDRTRGYLCDQIVYQRSIAHGYSKRFQGRLRRISYRDPDTGQKLTFLTNRFDLATSTICLLYKKRWKVELFFKALKQNLKIRKFLGISENAVKAQILIALIAYLLIQIIRYQTQARISIPDTLAVLGTLLLLHEPLKRLLGSLPRVSRYPPPAAQLHLNI